MRPPSPAAAGDKRSAEGGLGRGDEGQPAKPCITPHDDALLALPPGGCYTCRRWALLPVVLPDTKLSVSFAATASTRRLRVEKGDVSDRQAIITILLVSLSSEIGAHYA